MKKLLVIRVSKDVKDESIGDIYCHAKHYNIEASHIDVKSIDELETALIDNKFDYLYFAGHGDKDHFGDKISFEVSWSKIGETICKTDCLNENSIIMLYCCKGGLNIVAYQLIAECNNISYICGAKQDLNNIDLIIGFNVFMYNIERCNIDPVLAAHKSTAATDIRFECYDRNDVESNPNYYFNFCKTCKKSNE